MYNTFIYEPLYNGLIGLTNLLPWFDAGVILIIFTIIVKFILYPLSKKAARTQVIMKSIEPEINKIKEAYKDNRQVQAQKMMDLYREKGINPFSSILLMFIQIPILWALYNVYLNGIATVNVETLYSFVEAPVVHHTVFLGLIDITQKSYVLAFAAALTQFIQARIMAKNMTASSTSGFGQDFAKNMSFQMQYLLPLIIFVSAISFPSALALYWATSNIFMIIQELVVKKQIAQEIDSK